MAALAVLPGAARAAESCADCHRKQSAALVMEWDRSKHAKEAEALRKYAQDRYNQ